MENVIFIKKKNNKRFSNRESFYARRIINAR